MSKGDLWLILPALIFLTCFALGTRAGWKIDLTFLAYLGALVFSAAIGFCVGTLARYLKTIFS